MKKILALVLSALLMMMALTGCTGTTVVVGVECTCAPVEAETAAEATAAPEVTEAPVEATEAPVEETEAPVEETEAPAEETAAVESTALKTGLAVVTSLDGSASASAEAAGVAKYDITIAAVTVDANGVIHSCAIDSVPATVNFDAAGAITTDVTAAVQTKNELSENYGMVAYGGAVAEWDAQVAALADVAVGKTVEELKTGWIENGKAKEGTDLATSATIYLGGYVSAIEAAVANAQELGAQVGDEMVLVTENSIGSSVAATAEKNGTAQLDANIAVVTKKDGVITSCYIDAVQAKIAFDAAGAITTDLTAAVQTKNELGENYGMVAWGGAIAEWDAQAAAFAKYVTGKTAEEVAGIAITETTKPAEGTDLASSVTISVGGFQSLIAKAFAGEAAEAPVEETETPVEETEAPAEESAAVESTALKTGLAVVTSLDGSASASAEAAGVAKYDITIAAVTVDANGVIHSCAIDSVPATVNFDAAGAITTDVTAAVQTKNELSENYGMVAYGGAVAEWDAQVAALADVAVGKTVEELKTGWIENGKAKEGTDLATSATIYLGGYVSAIEAAVANAQELGAQVGDEMVLVTENSIGSSVAATAEKNGTAQLDANIAVVTKKDGVITSCYIDAVQAKIAFDAAGAITTDLTAAVQTKNELGENYGMVAWGGAIAEWDAQAAAFAKYVTGKTAEEVAGIAITETTKPAEGTDLASSVTISVGGFQSLIAKAMQ